MRLPKRIGPRSAALIFSALIGTGCGEASSESAGGEAPPAVGSELAEVTERIVAGKTRFGERADGPWSAPSERVAKARRAISEGNQKRAFHLLRRELEEDDTNAEAHYRTATIHFQRSNFGAAFPHYAKAIEHGPTFDLNVEAFFWYGVSLRRLGRQAEAEVALRGYVDLAPEDGRGHRFLGMVLLERGEEEAALASLQTSLDAFTASKEWDASEVAFVHQSLGELYLERGEFDKAEKSLSACVQLAPDRYRNFYRLSRARELNGDTEGAREAMAAFQRGMAEGNN